MDVTDNLRCYWMEETNPCSAENTQKVAIRIQTKWAHKRMKTMGSPNLSIDEEDTESKQEPIKPKFRERDIVKQFGRTLRSLAETPIEYFEAQLYDLTKLHQVQLLGRPVGLEAIDRIHHIVKLKEVEMNLTPDRQVALNRNLERVIDDYPAALEEYKLVVELVNVLSGLVVKWDILLPDNYQYRIRGRTMVIRILDLGEISKTVFSIDTLWLATMIHVRPFSRMLEEGVRQYARVLVDELAKILNEMLALNPIDLKRPNNVAGYLAARVPSLRLLKHMQPDYVVERVRYQKLSLPTGLFQRCSKEKSSVSVERLKKRLIDFEMLYRAFEIEVVRSLLLSSYSEESSSP